MIKFTQKKISQVTLGEKLKGARQALDKDLDQISKEIKIKKEYLEFIEQSNYHQLPSSIFIKNYVKVYSQHLELPWSRIKEMLDKEINLSPDLSSQIKSTKHFHRPALVLPKFLSLAIIAIGLVVFFSYLGWQVNNFIQPPPLNLTSPDSDITVTERFIEVKGSTSPEAHISINGQEIAVDKKGYFQEIISLRSGFNSLKIIAQTKHSRERIIYKQIIVDN